MARAHPADEVSPEQHQQLVAEYDAPRLIHGADAIAVTVERDPQLGARAADGGLEVAQVLEHRGVGVVVREAAVGLAEQRHNLGAELSQGLDRDEARHAVATVHHRLDPPG